MDKLIDLSTFKRKEFISKRIVDYPSPSEAEVREPIPAKISKLDDTEAPGLKELVPKQICRPYPFTALKAIGPQLSINSVGLSSSQSTMAKKACSSTSTQEDQDNDALFNRLLSLAKSKLKNEENPDLKCAACEINIEKIQVVGVALEKIIEINKDPNNEKHNVGNIWLCNVCGFDYKTDIAAPFEVLVSKQWTGKGKPAKGPVVNCVMETVTRANVIRVNELKINYNDVEYLLFNRGDPFIKEGELN